MKQCTKCKELKDESEFYTQGIYLHSWCKKCECVQSHKRNKALYIHTRDASGKYIGRRGGPSIKQIRQTNINYKSACTTLKTHHEELKDDPEHLPTEFLQKLIGRKCE